MPVFSVVIPLYNKGPHVERAVNSVLNQTIKDLELIVVDGGSDDNGPDIVKSFTDSRIRFMEQVGRGVSNGRNLGVEACTSEMIAFLDADDEWMPRHLEIISQLCKDYPSAGAYTTAYKILEGNGLLRWAKYKEIPPSPWRGEIPNYFRSGSLGDYPVWTSVVCIPKKIFLGMGGFPEDEWYGEDADLFGRIALKYPIAFDWYLGGIYHWGTVNRISNRELPLTAEPFVTTAETAIKNGSVNLEILDDLKEYIFRKEASRALRLISKGKYIAAFKILMKNKTKYRRKERFAFILLSIPYAYITLKYIKNKVNKVNKGHIFHI